MHSKDVEFFEQYKRLDKVCSEMYSCRGGVTAYIEDMESEYGRGERTVEQWAYDYKMLKHVRWVRSQIAHEVSKYRVSDDGDLEFVYDFYERIFSGDDPVTLLENAKRPSRKKPKNARQDMQRDEAYYDPSPTSGKKSGCSRFLAFTAFIGAIILALLIYFLSKN